jgi:hypothetical protein
VALSWASADPATARVTANGVAVGVATGATTIGATTGTSSASVGLTVSGGTEVTTRALAANAAAPAVTVKFDGVTQAGTTTLALTDPCPAAAPAGFELGTPALCLDLATTAAFTGLATVCVDYGTFAFAAAPQLFHFEGGAWVDVTTSVDTLNKIACGTVSSFSPFALMERSLAADAGPDQVLECTSAAGAAATLDGSRSSLGPDLSYAWKGVFGTVEAMIATVTMPLGTTTATLEVSDGTRKAQDALEITVGDTQAPLISAASANPPVLWPPNRQWVPVTVSASAADVCDPGVRCAIEKVSSNEGAKRDDDSSRDWEITGDLTLRLRADRAATGSGRLYSIGIACSDASGNRARRNVEVAVPLHP